MLRRIFILLLLPVMGLLTACGDNGQENSQQIDTVVPKDIAYPLEFNYKPGFVGKPFIAEKGVNIGKALSFGDSSQKLIKMKIDKIDYIQNYVFQRQDPSFILVEDRPILVRVHAYAVSSNSLAPDMRLTITGPEGIKFVERLPANGVLPYLPEDGSGVTNYTRTPFAEAYFFKIPANHIKSGEYKITLEPLPKAGTVIEFNKYQDKSGVTKELDKYQDTISVLKAGKDIAINVYKGRIGNTVATVPSMEKIRDIAFKYWPIKSVTVNFVNRTLTVDEPLSTKNIPSMYQDVLSKVPAEYPASSYYSMLKETAQQFNQTRLYTEYNDIQVLFLPIPGGSAQAYGSIVIPDKNWELELAKQLGHFLGVGRSPDCAELPSRLKPTEIVDAMLYGVIEKDVEGYGDKEDMTFEPIEGFKRQKKYWAAEWVNEETLKITSPLLFKDLMSVCRKTGFPHPHYYAKALNNINSEKPFKPLLGHPSLKVREFYKKNGLAMGKSIRVAVNIDLLKRAIGKKLYDEIPEPVWAVDGELKRLVYKGTVSPHAVVVYGENAESKKIIELYVSSDQKELIGVANVLDIPKNVTKYELFINNIKLAEGALKNFVSQRRVVQAKDVFKDGALNFIWNSREVYHEPGVLLYKEMTKPVEVIAIGLMHGSYAFTDKDTFANGSALYLILPYTIFTTANGMLGNIPLLDIYQKSFGDIVPQSSALNR